MRAETADRGRLVVEQPAASPARAVRSPALRVAEGALDDPPEPKSTELRLVMTLLVSDEVDLVELNIDYHLAQGVDFVVVTVNRGSDELVAKVQRYVDRGVASIIHEPSYTYAQAEWVTRMARAAYTEHGADWVINCDPDEFYWPEEGDLKEVFSLIPEEYGLLTMPVCHFPPPSDQGEDGLFVDRMTVRETWSLKPGAMAPFFKTAHRGTDSVVVGRGNHRVFGTDLVPVPGWRPITGLHFPLRSYEQFERKVIKDGRAVANNPDPKVSLGGWRDLYLLHQSGDLSKEYAERSLDLESEAEGIRAGALVVDERLREWVAQRSAVPLEGLPDGEAVPLDAEPESAREEDAERLERLRREMMRAIYVGARELAVMERDVLLLDIDVLKAKAEHRGQKVKKYKEKHKQAKARFKAAKSKARDRRSPVGHGLLRGNAARISQALRGVARRYR